MNRGKNSEINKRFYVMVNDGGGKTYFSVNSGLEANTGPCNHCWGCVIVAVDINRSKQG